MKTINYQGQSIEVHSMSRIDGSDKRADGLHVWADELWRDAGGHYYAVRERCIRDSWSDDATITKPTETIRRISLRAAILWAVTLTGSDGVDLRRDAAALLAAGRAQVGSLALLDDNARRLLHEYLTDHPQTDARDVLNAALDFLLSNPEEDGTPQSAKQALRGAKERRQETKAEAEDFCDCHPLTLTLSKAQFGMLRQAARFDGEEPEDWVVDQLQAVVACYLSDEYGHRDALINAGWKGLPRPQIRPRPSRVVPRLLEGVREHLEARAEIEGTDLFTQFERMSDHGKKAIPGFSYEVKAELDPFHADLLRAFERRNNIDGAAYARAVLAWHLEEVFDLPSNGGETERNVAANIHEDGNYCEPMTAKRLAMMCRAAGLNPADYPDALEKDDNEADEPKNGFATGRRHVHDPEDIALLAAATPEPVEPEPLPEEVHQDEDDDSAGEQWKEGK